jgi:transposase
VEWIANHLVFVDESATTTKMVRLYGRAMRGQRARDAAPHGHWGVRTLIGALIGDGRTACMSIDAATDGEIFFQYVVHILVPELRPGDIVVLDNLRSHKQQRVTDAIGAAGCRLEYLPPYSPDLNPIEKMWSKVKAILRKLAARTSEALDEAIRIALESITPADAAGRLASCGYSIS